MRIKDIPWWNKPNYKLKKKGEDKLDPAELLAIILEKGIRFNESSIELANKLLNKHKSLAGVSMLSLKELEKEIGKIKALKIKAMFELFRETSRLERKGYREPIESAKDVYNRFVDRLKDKKKENFYALLLDSKNRIIKEELISVGTLNASIIHPREVFKSAIRESANSIILVHNHPSGDCNPSKEDEKITEKLVKVGELLGIKVLDHVIVGKDSFFSFKDDSLLF